MPNQAARRRHAWARAAFAAILAFGLSAQARPAPAPRVVLLDLAKGDLARRLLAELTFTGLAPVPSRSDVGARSIPEAGARVSVTSERTVEIEFIDAAGHRTDSSTLSSAGNEATFPVRVVEYLRARLLHLGFDLPDELPSRAASSATAEGAERRVPEPTPPPAAEAARVAERVEAPAFVAAPPVAPDAPLPSRPIPADVPVPEAREPSDSPPKALVLWSRAGPAGHLAPGGFGVSFAGALAVGLDWDEVGLGIAGSFPLIPLEIDDARGEANISPFTLGVELRYPLWSSDRWRLAAGAGGGVVGWRMQARAEQPFMGRQQTLISGRYYLHAALSRALDDWLQLGVMVAGGLNSPRPVVRFDENEVASWGPGFAALTVFAELRWRLNESSIP